MSIFEMWFDKSWNNWWAGWMILVVIGILLFGVNPNIEFKRKYFRAWQVFGGAAMIVFAWGIGFPVLLIIFPMLPMVTFVTYINYKTGRICGNCGRYNQSLSTEKMCCRACGAEIKD